MGSRGLIQPRLLLYFARKYDTIESERRLIAVDWENIPKIDAHIHLMPGKLRCFADVDIRNSLDETLKTLDEALSGCVHRHQAAFEQRGIPCGRPLL